jgi:adenosylcobinamide kinase/adenosylcobinamide-phosphate guanylyltransferase
MMGALVLITGGARSGKSAYAERRAAELAAEVTYVATAEPMDGEMRRRIERHRRERPAGWVTVEAPRDAGRAISLAATPVVLLDCLTVLASNALLGSGSAPGGAPDHGTGEAQAGQEANAGGEANAGQEATTGGENAEEDAIAAVLRETDAVCAAALSREGTTLVVTNEVGLGVHPPTRLGRWYRDALGRANQRVAAAAGEVVLLVSGIPVRIR